MIHDIQSVGELLEQVLEELMPDDIPLTRKQAAYLCGVDPHTIDHWAAAGKIHKRTRGGLTGYMRSELKKVSKYV